MNTSLNASDVEVVWPLGRRSRPAAPAGSAPGNARGARGPLDLNSATVAFVWTYARKGDDMYRIMQGMLRGEYPDIRFVDHDAFGNIHGASETEVVAALPQLLRDIKADVAVVGIAG